MNFDLVGVNAVVQMTNKDMVVRATVSEVGKEEKGDEDFTTFMNKLDSGRSVRDACNFRFSTHGDISWFQCSLVYSSGLQYIFSTISISYQHNMYSTELYRVAQKKTA